MSKTGYIFCEGGAKSHDRRILDTLILELAVKPRLVTAGSKRGMPAFIDGYFSGQRAVSPAFQIAFRDRDFDFPIPDKQSLIYTDKKRLFASYRTTIENYLIAPDILFNFIEAKGISDTGITNEASSKLFLDEVAAELKFYSAARHTLGSMRENLDFGTTWMPKSGALPESLEKEYCIEKSLMLIEPSREKSSNLSVDIFEKRYSEFLGKFDQSFFEKGDYLIWFNGKDLMELIRKRLANTTFSEKAYFDFAHQYFDFRKFPDLTELFDKLNSQT
ncbi:MAG: DUF4435 domain-containing protein [Saprospiraceae bacterium]|jgi:hypothetical protein|nr:DUF4435 domain-containing protein [Saprospiraceae bacterium]